MNMITSSGLGNKFCSDSGLLEQVNRVVSLESLEMLHP